MERQEVIKLINSGETVDLEGARLDMACLPLWCGSLRAHISEGQAMQLLYHILSLVEYSKHISEDTKRLLLTQELVEYANQFHRVGELSELHHLRVREQNNDKDEI